MNTLVIYDSQFGNTKKIADSLVLTLGEVGFARALNAQQARPADLKGVNLLVVGCPTQAWHPTPPIVSFVTALSPEHLHHVAVACFDTRLDKPRWITGSAARAIAKLVKKVGGTLLAAPESFLVESGQGPLVAGEIERANLWAYTLFDIIAERDGLVHAM